MRIGIDCRTILNPRLGEAAGIGHYTYFLVKHLLELDHENEYVLFFDSRTPDITEFDNANSRVYRFPFSQYKRFLPFGYSHMLITAFLTKCRLDLFHAPANIVPLTYLGRSVITVHDLAIFKNPSWFPSQIFSTRLLVPQSLKRARHIIAVSQSTKNDLADLFSVPSSKVSVVYEAPFVDPINVKDRNVDVLKKFKLKQPYFLFVGTLEPRKNLPALMTAFKALRKQTKYRDASLVVAGSKGPKSDFSWKVLMENAGRNGVKYAGYVTHNEKIALYKKAHAFVMPSLYEGFGLPVLEAMQLGVPVITSNVSALPEVAGRAALLVDPEEPRSITKAMARLLDDEPFRVALAAKGKTQAKKFAWEKVAAETLAVYKKAGEKKATKAKKKKPKRRKK